MRQENSLQELYGKLKQFHLSDSLGIIGAVNAALKYNNYKIETDNIPPQIVLWLERNVKDERTRRSVTLNMTRMARYLLLSSANDYKGTLLDLNNHRFYKAYNHIIELGDPDFDRSQQKFNQYFSRIGQFQFPFQAPPKAIIGRAFLLYQELISEVSTSYDFNSSFEKYFNLSIFEFMAAGVCLWILTNGTLDATLDIDHPYFEHIITNKSKAIFLSLSSGTPLQYRKLLRDENWKMVYELKDRYAFDPFTIMPVILVERSERLKPNTFIVPQPRYLLERASTGIFYLLADKEKEQAITEGKGGRNPFRNAFGLIYRTYVGKQLAQIGQHIFVDLDDDFSAKIGNKTPDFALISGDICILFEVKTSLLNVHARTYFEPEKLQKEINSGNIVKAINQLESFKDQIYRKTIVDPRFSNIKSIISIIVGYEDIFNLNSTLLPMVHDTQNISGLQFAGITDIDAIGSAISQQRNVVVNISEKAMDINKQYWSFATVFKHELDHGNLLIDQSYKAFKHKLGIPPNR